MTGDMVDGFVIRGEWLAYDTGTCTCSGGWQSGHEPLCGIEPVARIGKPLNAKD